MIQEFSARLLPQQAASEQTIKEFVAREKGIDVRTINHVRVLKRSVDARHRTIFVNLSLRIYINEEPADDVFLPVEYGNVAEAPAVIVVGAGPGGLFAALRLIELGCKPVVVERGKDVHERRKDLSRITKEQRVNPESNYCFGEGGAGAYSDGKLYTRSKKRGSTEKILRVFCQHGASTSILADAHPHIGTDKLPQVIENIRKTILRSGGEIYFQTKMTALQTDSSDNVCGIEAIDMQTGAPRTFAGPVILATGHSARDIYRYLAKEKIEIAAKDIAVGVRLEHPVQLIDQIQYHNSAGRGKYLPAAEYTFVTQVEGRGVYSFCMCPGGVVIPSATDRQQIVVNGMSPSNRGTQWSNSGMVVELRHEDIPADVLPTTDDDLLIETPFREALAMMHFQEKLEKDSWLQGSMKQTAPAQRMDDFVRGKLSYDLPRTSYAPGLISSPLHFWLPPTIATRLRQAFWKFGQTSRGFLTNEALIIGVETRTSAPVRILRDHETLQHVRIGGLFPCGEGAGYAGGIVSAAIDGERCAEMCTQYIGK